MAYFKPFQLFKQMKASHGRLRLMGIDTGTTTGISLTTFDLRTAVPLTAYYARDSKELIDPIATLIHDNNVGGLLIGYSPMRFRPAELAHRTRVFDWMKGVMGSGELENFPFTFVNERFSSQDADILIEKEYFSTQVARERARNKYAAYVLTQNYLDLVDYEMHMMDLGEEWNSTHHS